MNSPARITVTQSDAVNRIDRDLATFAASVVRMDKLEPLVTELVRLRCARVHDCRLCGSLRQRKALDAGLDETMADKVDHYESSDLPDNIKAALRLADAMILTPGYVPETLRSDLAAHFTREQIAELLMDIVKWSQQKALVALRTEAPPWAATEQLDFDENGDPMFCGPVQTV